MINESLDIWKFLAGLGIFLMGLFFIEEALKNLAGSSFKKFLRKHTQNSFKAIMSGTITTAILQSSSVVTLIVLAFVGAGVMTLQNALGVIIGSNLGTTFTGWIIAVFGFQLDIESFSMPFIALGGLSLLFLKNNKRLVEFGRLIMGFGLLFLGLNFMKVSIELFSTHIDISAYTTYGPYIYFVVGLVLTAIIQSSSASMVITLSALHTGIISLDAAAAMVIGSDLGTTITILFGGLNGTPSKKRVALSHFIFNLITDLIALLLIYPLLSFISNILGVENPLITLVLFHSGFNLVGIAITFPFLGLFARFLENRFKGDNGFATTFINKVTTDVPEAAITAVKNEVRQLIELVFLLHLKILKIKIGLFSFDDSENKKHHKLLLEDTDYQRVYETIKQLEGEIVPYYLKIQNEKLENEESNLLNQLIHATRHAMIAAKGVKDIAHNIEEFEKSANDSKIALFELLKGRLHEFYLSLDHILQSPNDAIYFESLTDSIRENQGIHDQFLKETYQQINKKELNEMDISTLLNVNREMYNANHALILTIKDTLLSIEQAATFNMISQVKE
jgi:phosphate:Na+ symporter